MTERRFNEDEVGEIFALAARAAEAAEGQRGPLTPLTSSQGMTLAQLQEIGRDVGIAPEDIANAARSLERVGRPSQRKFLGLPIGVGRTVELGRKLSDEEWEHLVVDLRETFDARGTTRSDGSLRQWTNGNLQALLEPTPTGDRVRLRTVKGNALSWMTAGAGMFAIGGLMALASAIGIAEGNLALGKLGFVAAMGAGMFALGALQLPAWARERRRQMEEIATRLVAKTNT